MLEKKNVLKSLILLMIALNVTGCYRMPTDEDYSVVPTTNNSDLTREKPSNNFAPNVGF